MHFFLFGDQEPNLYALAAAGDNGAANAPKADDRERGRVHAGAISPIPLTLPAHRNHTRYSTNSASGQSAGTPAFQAVITKLEQIEREATLRRAALESYAKAVEAFVRNSPEEQKKLAQEIQEGTLAYLNQYLLGTAAAKQPPKISYAGALKNPEHNSSRRGPVVKTRRPAKTRPALPKQGREPEATGTQTVRPSTAAFSDREAITKAVPQISAKDIPRLWATPTGWAVKPNTKAVYDLILKGSNAALICKATRCTVLERVEKWYTYRLTHTPNVLTGLLDNRLVTADIVSKEAEIQTGVKPVNCHSTGTLGPTSMWYISFKEEVRSFTLFGSSGYSKLSEKKKRIELHNPGCQEYCSPLTCRTASRCNNCGVATAKNTRAQLAPPARPRLDVLAATALFQLGHKHCAAAPKRVDGKITRLTASQLGEIRRQQTATRRACELAAKRRQEQRPKDGVQVGYPNSWSACGCIRSSGPPTAASQAQDGPYWLLKPCRAVETKRRSGEDRATARANGLKIAWANVGKSGPAHIALLQLAFEEGADVVCVQEPSVYPGTKTQNHPAYECYAPVDSWEQTLLPEREAERPRAMSYTRKAANLITQQRRNGDDRDIVWLEVNGFHIVNVYREPSTRRIIDYITSIQVPPNFLIGGDFNAKHDMFEPGVGSSNQGASLAAWSLSSGADFIGSRESHTPRWPYHRSNLLEHPVRGNYGRGQGADGNAGYRVTEANLPRFAHAINSGISHLPQPADVLDTRDLDDIAALLTTLFQNAIKAVGKRPQGTAKSAPWWTPACAELHAGYASARRRAAPEQERKRRDMLSTIRNAKRDYWRRVIDSAADDADLYKVVGWHKLAPSLKAPPLIVNGVSIESTKEKAEALLEKVLHRYDDSDDLEYDPLEAEGRRPILPWTTAISLEEVEKSVIGVSSTSPGADRVTVRLLKACWQHIRAFIRDFFQKCLELSHFPSEWKLAEVVMLPKIGKKDRSSVRSWRPIALLSCIGKGLERLVARRISWAAIHYGVISPQHGGALPKRSAVDLVASFVYDVESAFAQGKEVTLVTLDVQGAFDALLPRRLLERMRKQGWPGKLLRLIGSFLADRKVMVRLEGTYTAEIEDAMRNPTGFAVIPDSVMRWGAENKVAFAPEKLEMIHLSRKRNTNAPSIRVSPELTITPVTAVGDEQPALRWLGVWIDRKLSFKRHVAERSTKALKVARHIKGLAGVRFGPPAASLRKAVVTCVQSSLLYGSEVWYGGRRKPSASHGYNRNRLVSTRLGPLIEKTNKVMVLAARGVLPAWRTAPTASVLRDAGLPSGSTALEHARIRFALRLRTLDAAHPLVRRLETPILPWQRATKLRCADTLIPTDPTEGSTKEAAAEQFNTWWSQLSDNTITVFSDGSEQYKDGAKLWAFLECHALIDQFKVGIRWSPGHMGIEGNETADELADAGANEGRMDDDRSAEPTISGIGTTARALADAATSDWWTEPPELRLPRTLLHRLLAARTAHGDFAQYHRRFGHTDAELNCLCGYAKTPEHLVFCEISQRKFHAWPAKPERPPSRPKEGRRYMSAILAHPKLFEDFLTVTQYFAINARAQQTRDLTSPGGPQQSYGLPRQNRHSLTAV
ncbi:hypothetical protein DID88_000393 [Monilinia fructigena]|uniref:Reverse transcriptase domain-containing protein n=1 Tax=Monilinia fructigena TaxID=38457 RepID=A0A395IIP4_9HELO|nr:hypothetical protein DID88_000393 [Monilinia fructigena]